MLCLDFLASLLYRNQPRSAAKLASTELIRQKFEEKNRKKIEGFEEKKSKIVIKKS